MDMKIETYWDLASVSQIKTAQGAAKAFEEEFIHLFLKEVRKEFKSPLLGGSFQSKIYFDMFDMQLAKSISDSDSLGIKEYVEEAVKKYEKNSNG